MQLEELFQREIKTGYKNSVVFGGFSDYLAGLAEKQGFDELHDLALCYAVASVSERKKLLPILQQKSTVLMPVEEKQTQKLKSQQADDYRSNLSTPIQYMKSIGPKRASLLKKLGINTIEDLLFYFPRYFRDRSELSLIGSLPIGDTVNIRGHIVKCEKLRPKANMLILKAWVSDGSGIVPCIWFNQKFLESELYQGREIFISGKTEKKYNQFQLNVSEYEFLASADAERDLYPAALEIDLERDERESPGLGLEPQLLDFLRMDEELAHGLRLVVEAVPERVGGDVRPHEPKLALEDRAVGAGQGYGTVADRLDLGSAQLNTALDRVEYGIVVPRPAVFREDGIELGLLRHPSLSRRRASLR